MTNNCTMCGLPCSTLTCSMCYGDPYHGDDGYYMDWLLDLELQRIDEERFDKYMDEQTYNSSRNIDTLKDDEIPF